MCHIVKDWTIWELICGTAMVVFGTASALLFFIRLDDFYQPISNTHICWLILYSVFIVSVLIGTCMYIKRKRSTGRMDVQRISIEDTDHVSVQNDIEANVPIGPTDEIDVVEVSPAVRLLQPTAKFMNEAGVPTKLHIEQNILNLPPMQDGDIEDVILTTPEQQVASNIPKLPPIQDSDIEDVILTIPEQQVTSNIPKLPLVQVSHKGGVIPKTPKQQVARNIPKLPPIQVSHKGGVISKTPKQQIAPNIPKLPPIQVSHIGAFNILNFPPIKFDNKEGAFPKKAPFTPSAADLPQTKLKKVLSKPKKTIPLTVLVPKLFPEEDDESLKPTQAIAPSTVPLSPVLPPKIRRIQEILNEGKVLPRRKIINKNKGKNVPPGSTAPISKDTAIEAKCVIITEFDQCSSESDEE